MLDGKLRKISRISSHQQLTQEALLFPTATSSCSLLSRQNSPNKPGQPFKSLSELCGEVSYVRGQQVRGKEFLRFYQTLGALRTD